MNDFLAIKAISLKAISPISSPHFYTNVVLLP